MLAHAEERARERGAGNIRFVVADAQTHALPEQAFDRVFSRFGVMFFEDPAAAFSNVRRSMRRGARLGFICWQGMKKNDWLRVPFEAVASFIDVPPAPAPGAPGPFALGDRDRLFGLLAEAGFSDIEVESQERPVTIGGMPGLDNAVEFVQSIGMIASLLAESAPATRPEVDAALRRAFQPHDTPEGVKLETASWLVRATA
jgi:SAM-dependent methyltransferase